MTNLKVRVYKDGAGDPSTTVTIPAAVLKIAFKLIPKKALAALEDEGIDLTELAKLTENPDVRGQLVEVEDHEKNERVIVALE